MYGILWYFTIPTKYGNNNKWRSYGSLLLSTLYNIISQTPKNIENQPCHLCNEKFFLNPFRSHYHYVVDTYSIIIEILVMKPKVPYL